jgi:hypothetical protein
MRPADPRIVAGRAFVRSLNILLKFGRLYGYDHTRTVGQLETAWRELRTAIPRGSDGGLLLGATGGQLLLDGVPLEGSPAEKHFAQLLSAAGLASVHFLPSVTEEELSRFAQSFPTSKEKPAELAQHLKSSLKGAKGVRINEICFIATDSSLKDASIAAQIAASTLGNDQEQFKQWLRDPKKLLELIAAADGSHSENGPGGTHGDAGTAAARGSSGSAGSGTGQNGGSQAGSGIGEAAGTWTQSSFATVATANPASPAREGHPASTDEEIYSILVALTSLGKIESGGNGGVAAAGLFHEQMAQLPGNAQDTLKRAISGLAAQASGAATDEHLLVQLAEHLAIRYALQRYERGDMKVNEVRRMLARLNQEIGSLRKVLENYEDKMSAAGLAVESHRDILDRQFWASVPENAKQDVLLSDDAWCIPPRNVQSYVVELMEKGDVDGAVRILQNYSACADNEDADARKRTAVGISEMAPLYAQSNPEALLEALRHIGLRLSTERDNELQALVSAAFVRLSQEATARRCYPAMQQALNLISGVDAHRPGIARSLRTKMGIEDSVPELVEEAVRARHAAVGLTSVLKQLPQIAMEQFAARFNRCTFRDDAEVVSGLASEIGEEGIQHLRGVVRAGTPAEAVESVGLLSKLDLPAVEMFLPSRITEFPLASQDRIVRQISSSGAVGRSRVLLDLLEQVDPLVMPVVVDEIGVAADPLAVPRLISIVSGGLPQGAGPYLRVKAIEALGRIHSPEAASILKQIVEEKKMFGWMHPQELRIAALQALEKLDPDWVSAFLPKSSLDKTDILLAPLDVNPDSNFVRQRRHRRVRLQKPVIATSTNLKEGCRLEIKTASLSGGVASVSRRLVPGTQVQLKIQLGVRNLQTVALMRDYRAQDMAFEIVEMTLEERTKYRRLLAESLSSRPDRTATGTDDKPTSS